MADDRAEFQKLTAGYLEGDLSPDERERLKRLLESDAALRDEFLRELQINEALKAVAQEAPAGARGERSEFVEAVLGQWEKRAAPKSTRRAVAPQKKSTVPILIAAGALIGIAAVVLFFSSKNQEPRDIASPGRPRPTPKLPPPSAPQPNERTEPPPLAPKPKEATPPAPEPAPQKAVAQVAPPEKPEAPKPPDPKPTAPEPEPPKPKPAPRETTAIVASLLHVRGDVQIVTDGATSPARAGQPLTADQGLRTVGRTSLAILEYPDRTQVELLGDTTVARIADAAQPTSGKRIHLEQGALSADVARQPADQPMILVTPHAEARVVGTAFLLVVDPKSTAIEVDEGRVRFTRSRDGLAIDVNGGHFAISGPGIELSPRPIPQDAKKKPGPSKPDAAKVDAAIRKGIAFLKSDHMKFPYAAIDKPQCQDELVLWTMLHGGVPESDPEFSRLLQKMLKEELKFTYRVSLQAMILEQLDRVKHQGRIAQCAQFLVDNQVKHGQWSYGEPSVFANELQLPKETATPGAPKPKSGSSEASTPVAQRAKPRVLRKIPVTKKRDGTGPGDNSNSQYAALGLRACHDAGILLPKDVIDRARQWWTSVQYNDAKYPREPGGGKGWGYGYTELEWRGSMTVGAAGSLVIFDYILGEDWTKDKAVAGGLEWMANHFSVSANPEAPAPKQPSTHYYYLYALERLGMLYGTELIGKHEWYVEGAKLLLDAQKADGSWRVANGENAAYDTCFAILFLRRATVPLGDVASVDRYIKR